MLSVRRVFGRVRVRTVVTACRVAHLEFTSEHIEELFFVLLELGGVTKEGFGLSVHFWALAFEQLEVELETEFKQLEVQLLSELQVLLL